MNVSQAEKAKLFESLHAGPGAFVVANVFDAGSARIVAGLDGEWVKLDGTLIHMGEHTMIEIADGTVEIIEIDTDRLMHRTRNRPVASGRIGTTQAWVVGGLLTVIGLAMLVLGGILSATLLPHADTDKGVRLIGMVHPKVFEAVGWDPERVQGFAFGGGIDRMAMLKYGVPNIHVFFENDVRFLRQYR